MCACVAASVAAACVGGVGLSAELGRAVPVPVDPREAVWYEGAMGGAELSAGHVLAAWAGGVVVCSACRAHPVELLRGVRQSASDCEVDAVASEEFLYRLGVRWPHEAGEFLELADGGVVELVSVVRYGLLCVCVAKVGCEGVSVGAWVGSTAVGMVPTVLPPTHKYCAAGSGVGVRTPGELCTGT